MNRHVLSLASVFLFALCSFLCGNILAQPQQTGSDIPSHVTAMAQQEFPLVFEKNVGQYGEGCLFVAVDKQATYNFQHDHFIATVTEVGDEKRSYSYGTRFVGISSDASIAPKRKGRNQRTGRLNVLNGEKMHGNIPHFQEVEYKNLWNGVSARFYSSDEGMKYDFILQPGANPEDVQFVMDGVEDIRVTADGELSFETPFGNLQKGAPLTFQMVNGARKHIECAYQVKDGVIGFELGEYDPALPVIIDPITLKWATVLGESLDFQTWATHYDQKNGLLYLTGDTEGGSFTTNTSIGEIEKIQDNAFIMCMNKDGSEILWTTIILGQNEYLNRVYGYGLEVNEKGEVFVVVGADFPGYTKAPGRYNTWADNSAPGLFINPFGNQQPEVNGVKMSFDNNYPFSDTRNFQFKTDVPALFKLSAGGDTLRYFSYITQSDEVKMDAWDGPYWPRAFPMVLNNDGHIVLGVNLTTSRDRDVDLPENEFSPFSENIFSTAQPRTAHYGSILTIDTETQGPDGLVDCGMIEGYSCALDKDGEGNIYFLGRTDLLQERFQVSPRTNLFHLPIFTHVTHDTAILNSREGFSELPFLVKTNADASEVLFGSLIGYEHTAQSVIDMPYLETGECENMTVSASGDVYFSTPWYAYPDDNVPEVGRPFFLTHDAPKQTTLMDWYDPECGGTCPMASSVEKYPAGNYQNPEWLIEIPHSSWEYTGYQLDYDDSRGTLHLLSEQMQYLINSFPELPQQPFTTPDAFNRTASNSYSGNYDGSSGYYMQITSGGDVEYASIVSPSGILDYFSYAIGMHVDTATNESILVRSINYYTDGFAEYLTPSYRDSLNGSKVEVINGDKIVPLTNKARTSIMVFHEPFLAENVIDTFADGEDEFCAGTLVGVGDARSPLSGNKVQFASGDGSEPAHNLPELYQQGVPVPYPPLYGVVSEYQWQERFRAPDDSAFSDWEDIAGATKQALDPQIATQVGTVQYRRIVSIDDQRLVSNVIEYTVAEGSEGPLSVTGPQGPVFFCPGTETDLGIEVEGQGSGTISWQWYNGYTPLAPGAITPVSGSGTAPEAFSAKIDASASETCYFRLLVTNDATGCKQELFVSMIPLTAAIYNSDSISICPTDDGSITLGPGVVNPAFDYRYTHPDNSESFIPKPEVSVPGQYTLEVSVADSGQYCVSGATTVVVSQGDGPFDASFTTLDPVGFCESDADVPVGYSGAPATGYTYSWFPSSGLNDASIANPDFSPASAAFDKGVRTIDYLFRAVRESDGCVYTTGVTVSDTTLAIASVGDDEVINLPGCKSDNRSLPSSGSKGNDFRWSVVSTTFTGGTDSLTNHPDFGLGEIGQATSSELRSILYWPEGDYEIELELSASFGTIGQTACMTRDTLTLNIFCGVPQFQCRSVQVNFPSTSNNACAGDNTILYAQNAEWASSSWTVLELNGQVAGPATLPKGLFAVQGNEKGSPIDSSGGNHPVEVVANFNDSEWGFENVDSVLYRFTGVYVQEDGTTTTCTDDVTLYAGSDVSEFEFAGDLTFCKVAGSETAQLTGGNELPYAVGASTFSSEPEGGRNYSWYELPFNRSEPNKSGSISDVSTLNPTLSPEDSQKKYLLRVWDASTGCSKFDTLELTVKTLQVDAGGSVSGVCPGTIIQLGSSPQFGNTYSWTPAAGLFFPLTGGSPTGEVAQPYLNFPDVPSGEVLTLTVEDTVSGCVAEDEIILTSSNNAPPAPAGGTINVCPGLSANIGPDDAPLAGVSYLWTATAPAESSWLSSVTSRNPKVSVPEDFTGNATFTLTITNGSCGQSQGDYIIAVSDPGISLSTTPVTTSCAAPLEALESGISLPSGFTGEWIPATGLFTDVNGSTAYTAGGTIDVFVGPTVTPRTYYLKVTSPNDCITVYEKSITPPTGAQVSAGDDETWCAGGEAVKIGDPGNMGTISWEAIGISSDPTATSFSTPSTSEESDMMGYLSSSNVAQPSFEQTAKKVGAYKYKITVTDQTTGCSLSDEMVVRVPDFESSLVGANRILCQGTPSKLSLSKVPDNYVFSWSVLSPVTESLESAKASDPEPIVAPTVGTVYELTYTQISSGCQNTEQLIVEIAPGLDLTAVPDVISCEDLTDVDVTAYIPEYDSVLNKKWYRTSYPAPEIAAPVSVDFNSSQVYILEATNDFGCRDTTAIHIFVEKPKKPGIAPRLLLPATQSEVNLGEYAPAQPSTLNGQFHWQNEKGYDADSGLVDITVSPGIYYLYEVSQNGCISDSSQIVAYSVPLLSYSGSDSACAGLDVGILKAVSGNGEGQFVYQWQKTNEDPASSDSVWASIPNTNQLEYNAGRLSDTTWFRVLVSEDGQDYSSLPGSNILKITNKPQPSVTASLVGGDTTACIGDSMQLTATATDVSYAWSGPQGFSSGSKDTVVGSAAIGSYVLTVTSPNGCTNSDTVSVGSNPSLTTDVKGLACLNEQIIINGMTGDNVNVQWQGPNGFSSTEDTLEIDKAQVGQYIAVASFQSGGTCTTSDTVEVFDLPRATVANDGPHCEGNIVRLYEFGGDAIAWEWHIPGGLVSYNQNPIVSPVTDGDHIVRVTSIHGCSRTDTTTVCVSRPTALCQDDLSVYLDAEGEGALTTSDVDEGSLPGSCFGLSSMSLSHTVFGCDDVGDVPVELTVTDSLGCVARCETMVSVSDTMASEVSCDALEELILVWAGTEVYPSGMESQNGGYCSVGDVAYSLSPDFSSPSMPLGCREQLAGEIELTVYIQDGHGNVNTCTVTQMVPPHPDSEHCTCDSEHLELHDQITPDAYQASATIVSTGEVMSGDTVMMKASQSITLQAGFRTYAGGTFGARIDTCGEVQPPSLTGEQDPVSEGRSSMAKEGTSVLKEGSMHIWPNPFRGQLTVAFELTREASVNLHLTSIHGGRMATLLNSQPMAEGRHQLTVDGAGIPAGIYILTMQAGNERETRRVVRIK